MIISDKKVSRIWHLMFYSKKKRIRKKNLARCGYIFYDDALEAFVYDK